VVLVVPLGIAPSGPTAWTNAVGLGTSRPASWTGRCFHVRRTCLRILTATCLMAGTSTLASAASTTRLLGPSHPDSVTQIERVDYTWNHQHYHHRAWDKEHKRWRYYN
jgi:hypothetical protein